MRRLLAALALAAVMLTPVLSVPGMAHAKANLTTVSNIEVAAIVATDNQPLPEYTPVVKIKPPKKVKVRPIVIKDVVVENQRREAAERRRLQRLEQSRKKQSVTVAVVNRENKPTARSGSRAPIGAVGKTSGRNWATPGQCTWGAQEKWRQATGSYLGGFFGNAHVWGYRAAAAGYNVGTTPRSRSVLVMQPGVHGSSGVGHVAWVTGVSGNKVTVVEMNALAGPYNWNTRTLTHQGGMQYIYAP